MYLCLIPPKGMYRRMAKGFGLLALGPLIREDPDYGEKIRSYQRLGMPLIVDNGAAENNMLTAAELQRVSLSVHANEIVLPDELGDLEGTLKRARNYVQEYDKPGVSLMGVVQGQTMEELKNCIIAYHDIASIRTLGIPRLLIDNGPQSIRLDLANWINDRYLERFMIHFLGTNPRWPLEIKYAGKYVPFVRSVDTSMPYNYGLSGVKLGGVSSISRAGDYFTVSRRGVGPEILKIIDYNEKVMMEWVKGDTR